MFTVNVFDPKDKFGSEITSTKIGFSLFLNWLYKQGIIEIDLTKTLQTWLNANVRTYYFIILSREFVFVTFRAFKIFLLLNMIEFFAYKLGVLSQLLNPDLHSECAKLALFSRKRL